jgi:hypothetical protein
MVTTNTASRPIQNRKVNHSETDFNEGIRSALGRIATSCTVLVVPQSFIQLSLTKMSAPFYTKSPMDPMDPTESDAAS